MEIYQKVRIDCVFCKQNHKLRVYNFRDKYECPTTGGVFEIDEKYTIHVVGSADSMTKQSFRSLVCLDELLPLFDMELALTDLPAAREAETQIFSPEAIDETATDGNIFSSQAAEVKGILAGRHSRMDRYNIIEKLGEGGFGLVYKSFDSILHRNVALKISKVRMDEEQSRTYEREAKILASLNHPNIVQIFDFGLSNQRFSYIVMEYIENVNIMSFLDDARRKGVAQFQLTVCHCFADLADALIYLHDKDVYHQDIKPLNILMSTETSCPKLVDFGLAKIGNKAEGNFAGTYRYSAPERFSRNFKPTAQSDIYSLGAVLYEVLTAQYANPGEDIPQILSNTFNPEMRIFPTNCQIDDMLQEICNKCLAANSRDRYQNARDLHTDLIRYIASNEIIDTPYLYFLDSLSQKKTIFPLRKHNFYIGRSFNNDLIILDQSISRVHALIYINDHGTFIKNLSKTNPITAGREKISYSEVKKLRWNDFIRIADHTFCYVPNQKDRIEQAKNFREAAENFSEDQKLSENMSVRLAELEPTVVDEPEDSEEDMRTMSGKTIAFRQVKRGDPQAGEKR